MRKVCAYDANAYNYRTGIIDRCVRSRWLACGCKARTFAFYSQHTFSMTCAGWVMFIRGALTHNNARSLL
ncbi:unnamed protein product [Rodentolepis nana]|uniref:Transposase n=1 Tax=Rodentolepis nana TaxID=102285 RepID=A0A0R3TZ22_RODNA|nr:unnamed protein product [Rodentolepis nana]